MSIEETLEKLRGEHGEVWVIETSQGPVVFRAPTAGEFKRCKAATQDPKRAADADMILAQDVVVHPDKDAWRAMLVKRPGLAIKVAADALAIAMDDEVTSAKKFGSG